MNKPNLKISSTWPCPLNHYLGITQKQYSYTGKILNLTLIPQWNTLESYFGPFFITDQCTRDVSWKTWRSICNFFILNCFKKFHNFFSSKQFLTNPSKSLGQLTPKDQCIKDFWNSLYNSNQFYNGKIN